MSRVTSPPSSATISAIDRVSPTGKVPGPGPERFDGEPVGTDHRLVHRQVTGQIVLHPRWVLPDRVAHGPDHVGLVDGAGPTDQVTEMGSGPLDEPAEPVGGVQRLEAAPPRPATTGW